MKYWKTIAHAAIDVVVGVVYIAADILCSIDFGKGRSKLKLRRGGPSIPVRGQGQTKKPGSHSSGRHK